MKVNVNQKLLGVDGVEVLKGQNGRDTLLKDICITALCTPIQGDDEKKKWDKYELYKKVRDTGVKEDNMILLELKAEEITLLKQLIGKTQTQLIMGQCWEFLEEASAKKSLTKVK